MATDPILIKVLTRLNKGRPLAGRKGDGGASRTGGVAGRLRGTAPTGIAITAPIARSFRVVGLLIGPSYDKRGAVAPGETAIRPPPRQPRLQPGA